MAFNAVYVCVDISDAREEEASMEEGGPALDPEAGMEETDTGTAGGYKTVNRRTVFWHQPYAKCPKLPSVPMDSTL